MTIPTARLLLMTAAALALAGPARAFTPSADLLKCQRSLESKVRAVATTLHRVVGDCTLKAVNCKLAEEVDAVPAGPCLTAVADRCADPTTGAAAKVTKTEDRGKTSALNSCGLIPLADLDEFIGGLGFFNVSAACSAASASDLIDCLFDDGRCSAERMLFRLDPRAEDSLTAIGLAASFPCVAP